MPAATDVSAAPVPAPTLERARAVAHRLRRPVIEAGAVGAVASLVAVWVLRFWEASPRVPIAGTGDGRLVQMLVKGINEHGWWLRNPDLNVPYGQEMFDFPFGGENLQLAVLKGLTWVTGDAGLTLNLFYLASFPVVALVTYAAFRHLRFRPGVAGVVALLYAFLPYHFARGQGHLFRTAYVSAPLAALLLLWALSPEALRGRRRWALAVGAAVLVASTETMTTAFTMTLLAATGVVAAIRYREVRRLAVAGVLAGVLGLTFLANQAPTLAYVAANGTNDEAGRRHVWETEQWGLKLDMVVLPQEFHRIEALGDLGQRTHEEGPVRSEGGQALGVVGVLGFLAVLLALVGRGMGPPHVRVRDPEDRGGLLGRLGLLTLAAVLFGTVGGFSYLLALVGFAQVRVWNRIVILIAFFALVAVAIALERVLGWLRARGRPAWVGGAALAAVAAIGVLDQTPGFHPDYARADVIFGRERAFVRQVEAAMPEGAMVFQWPAVPFPENPDVFQMKDYDHLAGYLHSDSLRWSYGGIRGRDDAMWQFRLNDLPVGEVPAVVAAVGFDGLWLDTFGVLDGPATVAAFREATGVEPLVRDDGRHVFFDLRPLRRSLSPADRVLLRDEVAPLP